MAVIAPHDAAVLPPGGDGAVSRRSRLSQIASALGSTLLLICLLGPFEASAQEVALYAGAISSNNDWPSSYAWSFSYREIWKDYFSTTVSYLNQGHFPGHHRDGVSAEAWLQRDLFNDRMTVALGVGPFYYFDTTVASNGGGYSDSHGWAWAYSASATWQLEKKGWFAELRYDYTAPSKSIETSSITAAIGYRLQPDSLGAGPGTDPHVDPSEATVFFGKTVVNSFSSQTSHALAAEYRYRFGHYLRASVGYINEGNAELIRRNGAVLEGWLEPSFFAGRYSIGFGAGAYSAIDKYSASEGRHLSGIITLTMSYRFTDNWDGRFNWHRIVTNYDRDTDILLYGIGYRF